MEQFWFTVAMTLLGGGGAAVLITIVFAFKRADGLLYGIWRVYLLAYSRAIRILDDASCNTGEGQQPVTYAYMDISFMHTLLSNYLNQPVHSHKTKKALTLLYNYFFQIGSNLNQSVDERLVTEEIKINNIKVGVPGEELVPLGESARGVIKQKKISEPFKAAIGFSIEYQLKIRENLKLVSEHLANCICLKTFSLDDEINSLPEWTKDHWKEKKAYVIGKSMVSRENSP